MFEEEAKEYKQNNIYNSKETGSICIKSIEEAFQDGATSGYNKGYHDAEEHYMDVIDNQHKLIDESKKKHLEYTKTIIKDLLDNSDEYARQRAMDFLEEKQ